VLITHEHDIAMRAARVIEIRDGGVAAPDDPTTPTDLAGVTR
jgi:ABC-type lipoprotein export system ATPase subunit